MIYIYCVYMNFIRLLHGCMLHRYSYGVIYLLRFGKQTYRLEAALTRKAAWCRGLIWNCERQQARSRELTYAIREVLKTHRSDSIYVLQFSFAKPFLLANMFLRRAMRCMSDFYLDSFFCRQYHKFRIVSSGNLLIIWYRNYMLTQFFRRPLIFFLFHTEKRRWMVNEYVSKTYFDSGKKPIETIRTLLYPFGYTCSTLNILKILTLFNRVSELWEKQTSVWVDFSIVFFKLSPYYNDFYFILIFINVRGNVIAYNNYNYNVQCLLSKYIWNTTIMSKIIRHDIIVNKFTIYTVIVTIMT